MQHDNYMPSYFLAETLKYLLLLFGSDDSLDLADYVFTTEGHPVSIAPTCEQRKGLPPCSGKIEQEFWETKSEIYFAILLLLIIFIILNSYNGSHHGKEMFQAYVKAD